MPRRGLISAPPRERVLSAGSLYGSAASSNPSSPATGSKLRLWVLVDPETLAGRLIVYRPRGNGLERTDLGPINSMVVQPARGRVLAKWEVFLESGETVTANAAPCVCGAGKVGYAGPVDGPHTIETMRGSALAWLKT